MPDPSFSCLYVVPDFPRIFFSYSITTSLPLNLLFPGIFLMIGNNLFLVPVQGGEFSAHCCDSRRLSCLEVTRGLGENSSNLGVTWVQLSQ